MADTRCWEVFSNILGGGWFHFIFEKEKKISIKKIDKNMYRERERER